MAIVSLIFGIIAIILCFIPVVNVISILCAIIAFSTGLGSIISKNKKNKGMGIAGLIIGCISGIISLIISFSFLVGMVLAIANETNDINFDDYYNYENNDFDYYDEQDRDDIFQFFNSEQKVF